MACRGLGVCTKCRDLLGKRHWVCVNCWNPLCNLCFHTSGPLCNHCAPLPVFEFGEAEVALEEEEEEEDCSEEEEEETGEEEPGLEPVVLELDLPTKRQKLD